jgi:hypothetical protein
MGRSSFRIRIGLKKYRYLAERVLSSSGLNLDQMEHLHELGKIELTEYGTLLWFVFKKA